MPGPAPKPTQLRVLEGNLANRPLPAGEPTPPAVPVVKPAWLTELASVEWDRVAPQLERMGLLSDIDTTALAAYCEAFARFVAATRVLDAEGVLVPSARGDGQSVKNPAAQVARDAAAELKTFAAEFGMTPSARGRISINKPDTGDAGLAGILS